MDATRLLIVEDNATDAKLYQHMLNANPRRLYQATIATRLGDGLRLLSDRPFQIALLDLNLPDSRGLATLENLLKAATLPVVVLTGLEDEQVARDALRLGAQDYLLKDKVNAERLDNALSYAEIRFKAELAQREQARLQALLEKEREINTLRTHFISMISHDFRNPLATISVATHSLAVYYDKMKPEDRQRRFEQIGDAVRYLSDMTDDFLTMSRIEDGHISLNLDVVQLPDLCQTIVERFEASNPSHHLVLETPAVAPHLIDPHLITRALTNLISNAIKYSPIGTTVTVRVIAEEEMTRIEISDQGQGIPDTEQAQIFTPFYRASNARASAVKGTGLGLAIVKFIVELHQGQIEIHSRLDYGTTIVLWLPHQLGA